MNTPEAPRPSRNAYDPVAAMAVEDNTKLFTGSVTLRVFKTATIPEHRLLSTVSMTAVRGQLSIRFAGFPLPERNEQFVARMRRQRAQR